MKVACIFHDCARMRVGSAAYIVILVAAMAAARVAAKKVPLVDTEGGRVSGIVEESVKGRKFYSFYGIPFAQPPVGKLRFKDPEAPSPWDGIRDASALFPPCPQDNIMEVTTETGGIYGQEDCLYLSVHSPEVKKEEDLPVMVWIHGGAFLVGGAMQHRPHVLLDHDMVVVVVQYRLGVLGFLSTEDSAMPGNLGLKDQTMALQWVQRNIHHFGGDRTRVTIFGVSAGGASVHYQMLTPKAEGLFSRAILQSGTALCPWTSNQEPREAALQVAGTLGCPTDQGSNAILDCLQEVDANVLVPLYRIFRKWHWLPLTLTPWVDGHYLPAHPAQLVGEGRHAQVDIMAGVTKDEGAFLALPALGMKHLMKELRSNFSVAGPASLDLTNMNEDLLVSLARRMYLHYIGTTNATEAHGESLKRMFTDRQFAVCHDLTTAHHAAHLHPAKKTFRYELQHFGELSLSQLCPICGKEWVSHGDDLFYLFYGGPLQTLHSKGLRDLQRPDDLALRGIMTTLWTNFAATGNPTPDDSLGFKWEPSTADNLHYLSLTPSPSMQSDNREQVRKFHNALPTLENLILHPHLVERETDEPRNTGHSDKTEF